MHIPTDQIVGLRIDNEIFAQYLKPATVTALSNEFGCTDYTVVPNVERAPTIRELFALSDKEIMDAPHLDKQALKQVHALKSAVLNDDPNTPQHA